MIIPRGISEQDWFDMTTLDLVQYGVLPRYSGDWRECADQWFQNSQLAQFDIPLQSSFVDFSEWASRFNQAVFG